MQQLSTFSIPQLYHQVNKTQHIGIEGYQVYKRYQDPLQMMRSRELSEGHKRMKKHEIKRGSFLDDEAKLYKHSVGPGKYKQKDSWPKKTQSLHHESKKVTYIEELMKKAKKQKKPAPGQYNIFKSQKQLDEERKKLSQKKSKTNDRINYLDHVQFEATLTPGSGQYNPRIVPDRMKTQGSKVKPKPEDWRAKHTQAEKKKKKPSKYPDMGSYEPQPNDMILFSNFKKMSSKKDIFGKVDRFKLPKFGSGLGPGKYGILQKWHGKDKKIERHGLEAISKGFSKSVYYH